MFIHFFLAALIMLSSCTRLLAVKSTSYSSLNKIRGGFPKMKLAMVSSHAVSTGTGTGSKEKLDRLRDAMAKEKVDCFIVPTDDPHMSEYTALYYNRREFITGFTGSAGVAVITKDKALLFVDGRYHNQAELEVSADNWTVMKQGLKGVPGPVEWISQTLSSGSVVGIDPELHAAGAIKTAQDKFAPRQISIKPVTSNPVDLVWTDNRPAPPTGALRIHPIEYAGQSVGDKLTVIRGLLTHNSAGALVSTTLDEIAWVYNVRGSDVPCCPVTMAYSVITEDHAHLFADLRKVTPEVSAHLAAAGVTVRPYEEALPFVADLSRQLEKEPTVVSVADPNLPGKKKKVWYDGKSVNYAVYSSIPQELRLEKDSPIVLMKACKNDAELKGMKACHLRDGAAVVEFFAWLFQELETPGRKVSEVELDEHITASRASFGMFLEPSFPTIAGVNSNGAIVHYRAVAESCKECGDNDMVLLDSGGQYTDGTTDVTRTFHTGSPTDYQREMFTRVLKGNIAVDSRVFIAGTAGCQLDSYARESLWEVGKDFIHGTGHGVGAALNVHEGPHRISRGLDPQALLPGMVVSNEPGYYEAGNFGIRIENLLVVVPKQDIPEFAGRGFLGFEKLTHIPIQKKLINVSMLTQKETQWIDRYHSEIREKVGPLLKTDRARKYLAEATSPLV